MNTNGSKPEMVARLFDAGLDSIRVSLNSVREEYYMKYYRPAGYSFGDVMSSIRAAKERRGFVSINYLTMPGFTDSVGEFNALRKFIRRHRVDMLQMRNLNFDPLAYFRELDITNRGEELLGIKEIIETLKRDFPRLKIGYFNPTRRMLAQNRLSEL